MKRADILFVGVKAQTHASGERILLGDYTGGGWAFMLQTVRFHCVGVWVSTGLPFARAYIYIYLTIGMLNFCFRKATIPWVGSLCTCMLIKKFRILNERLWHQTSCLLFTAVSYHNDESCERQITVCIELKMAAWRWNSGWDRCMNYNIRSPSNNQRGSGRETILCYTHKTINHNKLNKYQFLIWWRWITRCKVVTQFPSQTDRKTDRQTDKHRYHRHRKTKWVPEPRWMLWR